ncbi:MAG: radical SAM protein [Promethearchaeota archaeon]
MLKKNKKIPGYNKDALVKTYTKSNYRLVGSLKHSAIKPCHWQEQKLLTGRANRNCYKGYFGIESETCVQNTPTLPFCNHQCVFCWRDIENASYGATWKGDFDEPKELVQEMIRHSINLIFEHITIKKSMDNLEIMHRILYHYLDTVKKSNSWEIGYKELELAEILNVTRAKVHRAVLLLKNCKIFQNPKDDLYIFTPKTHNTLKSHKDVDALIVRDVTTKEEIEKVFENAKHPKHAAISLAGEPTLYPKIGELVDEFRQRDMCTFIVTNGTQPQVIKKLWDEGNLPTQLYVTLAAPNQREYQKICRPLEKNGWERLMTTMSMLPELPCRTVVRITSLKYININPEFISEYVEILKANTPDFIDLKGVTIEAHALEMENRLGKFAKGHTLREFAPSFEDLLEFAKGLEIQGGFEILETHITSRNILLRGKWPKGKSLKIDFSNV